VITSKLTVFINLAFALVLFMIVSKQLCDNRKKMNNATKQESNATTKIQPDIKIR